MKCITPLMFLIALSALGQGVFVSWNRFVPAPGSLGSCGWDGTYLVQQNFEQPTTGYDHGETWTESGTGTIDPAYTGIVLQGTQSLRFSQTAQTAQTQTSFSAQDEVWVYFLFHAVSFVPGDVTFIAWLEVPGSTIGIEVNADLTLTITGSVSATTVDSLSTNTTYHIWAHYKKGSGTDQVEDIGFSTMGIKPTSGNKFASRNDGTRTAQISKITLGWSAAPFTQQLIFDKIRVANTCIGDNPP